MHARARTALATDKNLSALADLSSQWIDLVHGRRPPRGIVLDMDSSVSPTHGEQEMSVWNGHYACTCYHPLFVFNQFGDLERCALRAGNGTAPTAGTTCSSPSWRAIRARSHASISSGRGAKDGRYVIFQMAEVAIAQQMFRDILRLIAELRPQPPPAPW